MDWLSLSGRVVLVTGFKNKKSVAWHVGRALEEAGARVLWSVHTPERAAEVAYAVLMLCSPRAAYIHGTTLEVTGGI